TRKYLSTTHKDLSTSAWKTIQDLWKEHPKKLILCGQHQDENIVSLLSTWTKKYHIPILADIISQGHQIPEAITDTEDLFPELNKSLIPDLILNLGGHFLSKPMKNFWRKYPPKVQLVVSPRNEDIFQCLSHSIPTSSKSFLAKGLKNLKHQPKPNEITYYQNWIQKAKEFQTQKKKFLKTLNKGFLHATNLVMNALPQDSYLHLANSMSVRYACQVGLAEGQKRVQVFANRGVGGIDGCLSSAVGMALGIPDKIHSLIIGDMAFFYDRNGLWHQHIPHNLRIILLNDHGGGIFKIIASTQDLPERDEYFVTQQSLSAQNTCLDLGIEYFRSSPSSPKDISKYLLELFDPSTHPKLLEIDSLVP
ncbi:MAG: 2-succinyl-5-enolpyruvyl-6-hydroxy-3-cyclohexene-1-carboxylic-acid synthase, partial [Cytophagales bacterium]|nr:2-succinyl-5-enolpyruvyl-6-hydroxy-3-cyclohexene-1-carboxylic-acid synthase [Cytophagales bacterium]